MHAGGDWGFDIKTLDSVRSLASCSGQHLIAMQLSLDRGPGIGSSLQTTPSSYVHCMADSFAICLKLSTSKAPAPCPSRPVPLHCVPHSRSRSHRDGTRLTLHTSPAGSNIYRPARGPAHLSACQPEQCISHAARRTCHTWIGVVYGILLSNAKVPFCMWWICPREMPKCDSIFGGGSAQLSMTRSDIPVLHRRQL